LASQWKELTQYRSLGISLARRDFKVRYAQTKLGTLWALIQPLLSMAVLFLVFQRALQADTQSIPFLSYTLSGLIFWGFFNYNLSQGAASLIQARTMLQKIYFPRILLVLSKSLVASVDLIFVLILFVFVAFADAHFTLFSLGSFVAALLMSFFASQGLALWFAALSLRFRDLQQIIPFFAQMLFFLSPIAYSPELWHTALNEKFQILLYLNPMMGILEIWRAGIFELGFSANINGISVSIAFSLALFLSGWIYFQKVERKMADLL
tara:strand:- start:2008 stop:2805 length:798 start_codon:yes stop_codon:yes gene_type:complete